MSAAEEHVHHLVKRNEGLQAKIDKLKEKGAKAAKHGVETLEIMTGAALGGLFQGMAKDQEKGSRLFHVPTDLALGLTGLAVGAFDVAGDYSKDVANLGKGFLAAFATDFGHSVGSKKRVSGSFFPKKGETKQVAAGSPDAMADALLRQMAGHPG